MPTVTIKILDACGYPTERSVNYTVQIPAQLRSTDAINKLDGDVPDEPKRLLGRLFSGR
jgi:hypothetical protein